MRRENLTIVLLLIIAVALVAIAVQPIFAPAPAEAQSSDPYPLYIEPGSEMLRAPDGSNQVYGKVMVDMRTGKIWGFPTMHRSPTPATDLQNKPPVSVPSSWEGSPLKTPTNSGLKRAWAASFAAA